MKRVVIIEGPDNIGKSYLCRALHDTLPFSQLRHFGPPTKKGKAALREQLDLLDHEVKSISDGDGIEIWDRSFIGEAVYGPLYRTTQYNHAKYWQRLKYSCDVIAQHCMAIVLYTDGEWYRRFRIQRKNDETQQYQRQEEAAKVATAFVDVLTDLPLKHRLLINCANYASFTERNTYILKRINQWMKGRAFEHRQTDNYTKTFFNPTQNVWVRGEGFEGRWRECDAFNKKTCSIGKSHRVDCQFGKERKRPTAGCGAVKDVKYIFVGEAPGHKGCGKLGIPFYDDASGDLLQEALDRLRILPTQYYMTNVVKCCPKDNKLSDFVTAVSRQQLECVHALKDEIQAVMQASPKCLVVAIGKVAGHELAQMKIDHVMAYHPAYYLRIGQRDSFMKDLRKVIRERVI